MWIKKVFAKLAAWFNGDQPAKVMEIAKTALPFVSAFATLTPTRADDELIRLFERYGLPSVDRWLTFPQNERGIALAWGVSRLLAKKYPSMPTRIIRWAVETAYNMYRESGDAQRFN